MDEIKSIDEKIKRDGYISKTQDINPKGKIENETNMDNTVAKWMPRVLVIGPGGIKGMKVLGFLSTLEDSGILDKVDTYCGVSVGAVISLLIICGYQIREIVGEAVKLDIFKEIGEFNFKSIMENRGILSNEPLRKVLTRLVVNKFGNVPTLYGLYMMTGKSYVAVTLNATDEICVMLNPFTTPEISCVDATMFSMNIPFIFYQLIYRGKTYVDGALGNPYPIDYFDDGNTNILGIYVKTIHKINTISSERSNPILERVDNNLSLGSYWLKIIHSLMDHRRNNIIQQASDKCRHVCLETNTTDTIGCNINTDDKALMLVEGFNQGKSFLNQLYNNCYTGPNIPEKQIYKYPSYYMKNDDSENLNVLSSMTNQ